MATATTVALAAMRATVTSTPTRKTITAHTTAMTAMIGVDVATGAVNC